VKVAVVQRGHLTKRPCFRATTQTWEINTYSRQQSGHAVGCGHGKRFSRLGSEVLQLLLAEPGLRVSHQATICAVSSFHFGRTEESKAAKGGTSTRNRADQITSLLLPQPLHRAASQLHSLALRAPRPVRCSGVRLIWGIARASPAAAAPYCGHQLSTSNCLLILQHRVGNGCRASSIAMHGTEHNRRSCFIVTACWISPPFRTRPSEQRGSEATQTHARPHSRVHHTKAIFDGSGQFMLSSWCVRRARNGSHRRRISANGLGLDAFSPNKYDTRSIRKHLRGGG